MTTATVSPHASRQALDDASLVMDLIGAELYGKQQQMVDAVFTQARVSVAGCNGSGKDFTAARLILAWLMAYMPSKVIVMAPTWRQVDAIVWNEMRAAYRALSVDAEWGLRMFPGSPQIESTTMPEDHFAVGFATSERVQDRTMPMGAGLQGFHSPHLLVVVSEAHAVAQSHITALQRLNAQCFLMTGNSFATSGEFFDSHHGKRELYSAIQISAFDTPNLEADAPDEGYPRFPGMVTKRDIERRAEDWGEDSPLYQAGVLGQFPENLEDMIVVPLHAAREAAARETEPDGPVVVACDVARFGKDKTVVVRQQGSQARVVYRRQGNDTMATAGWLGRYLLDNDVDTLIIDTVGLGSGVYDRLKEVGTGNTRLVAFNGGAAARDKTNHMNAIAEAWWKMREWFMGGDADIEDDGALIGQVSSRGYSIQSDRRIKLHPKEELPKSPDEADALAMTFAPTGGRARLRWIE